jgi:hypothetical protein
MRINRFIFVLCIIVFLNCAKSYCAIDTACRKTFIKKILNRNYGYIIFRYIDSANNTHTYLQQGGWFYTNVSENINIYGENCEKIIAQKILYDVPFTFSEFGRLNGIEINKTKFYKKWMKKGRKKFLNKFTHKRIVKREFEFMRLPEMYMVAHDFGIVIGLVEENDCILYISDCVER